MAQDVSEEEQPDVSDDEPNGDRKLALHQDKTARITKAQPATGGGRGGGGGGRKVHQAERYWKLTHHGIGPSFTPHWLQKLTWKKTGMTESSIRETSFV